MCFLLNCYNFVSTRTFLALAYFIFYRLHNLYHFEFLNDEQGTKLANVTVQRDDVLLNITGASVARCCVVGSDILPARVN